MKFTKIRLILHILLPIFLFNILVLACDISINKPEASEHDDMVLVYFGLTDTSARSIMPDIPTLENITYFKLYGTSSTNPNQEEIFLSLFEGSLDKAAVLLRSGRWNFTLTAYDSNDYPVLKGVRKNIDITVGYSAIVKFSLLAINNSYYEGTANIVINLPDDIEINSVETKIDDVILDPPLEIENRKITFCETIPVGDYLFHFFLKDGEGRVISVVTEMLVIRGGLESKKTIILTEDDFNNPPASPGNFMVTAYTDGNLFFSWENNSWNETGFILNNGTADYSINAGQTSYVLADSNPVGKTFKFYAVNDFGESQKFEYKVEVPETPIGTVAEVLSPYSIKVSWQAAKGAATYIFQRSETYEGPFTDISVIIDTDFIDTGLSHKTTYYYRVFAKNMFGNSSVSNITSAQTMSIFGSEENPFPLVADIWADGNIAAEDGIQWFAFTATAGTQYIHAEFGTLNDICIQLYNNNGILVGSETRLYGGTRSLSLMLTTGQQYYIRVRPYSTGSSGTYRIGINTSIVPPVIMLTDSIWADGYIIAAVGEQWFTFTATAEKQYIHVEFGTLTNFYARVSDNSGNTIGSETRLYDGTMGISCSLAIGQQYKIRIRPYSSGGNGTFKIAFNASIIPPGKIVEPALIQNTWANGNITSTGGTQWFIFTATSETQYIHVEFGALSSVYIYVYDSNGNAMGGKALSGGTTSTAHTLVVGQQYYIRVWANSSSGMYRILFNSSFVPPDVTTLTVNTWANGNIVTAGGSQWFSFTATVEEQYIHAEFGTLTDIYVRVYDSSGNIVLYYNNNGGFFIIGGPTGEQQKRLNGSTMSFSHSLTAGQRYYIQVWPYSASGNGTYNIAFNTSIIPPGATVLTENSWVNASFESTNVKWFRFTATTETQYIHIDTGSNYVSAQVYNSSGDTIGSAENYLSSTFFSRSVTAGQQYYIQVQNISSTSFKIAFNTSSAPPGTIALTSNTWTDGHIEIEGGAQWYKFTATATKHFIHIEFDTLDYVSNPFPSVPAIVVYDNSGNQVNYETSRYGKCFTLSPASSLISGQQYYIQVRLLNINIINNSSESYKITFNTSMIPPVNVTTLTANTWSDGNIPSSNMEQWFKFTATAKTQYIHFNFSTLSFVDVVVYDSSNNTAESSYYCSPGSPLLSCSVTSGRQYYIRVMPSGSSGGTYKITFNTSSTPPAITLPQSGFTTLIANVQAEWNSSLGEEKWFRFTATAATQYIHIEYGVSHYVQIYNNNGILVNSSDIIYVNGTRSITCALTTGQQYYFRVWQNTGNGLFKIQFSTSAVAPGITVTALTANNWTNLQRGPQWCSFTANAGTQYIHTDYLVPSTISVELYNYSGIPLGSKLTLDEANKRASFTLTSGQRYYILVFNSYSYNGNYTNKIAFNASSTPPP